MVKEFEQQNEQDLAILVDPWLPRARVGAAAEGGAWRRRSRSRPRSAWRRAGTRDAGWFSVGPGRRRACGKVRPRSSCLHELLEQLAMMRPSSEGGLAELFDVMPPAILRESHLIIISTRPLNLIEEAERSSRLSGTSARSLLGRVFLLNATQGDLAPLFQNRR